METPQPGEPIEVEALISWIDTCDQFEEELDTNDLPSANVQPPKSNADFLLIGSRALKVHWTQHGSTSAISKFSPCRAKIIKNHIDHRFDKDSDWDLICLNKMALIEFLQKNQDEIEEVIVNYLVEMEEFSYEGEDQYVEWIESGGQPKNWREFTLRVQMNDGEVIEIEYCTHHDHLVNYLNSIQTENVKVPFLDGSCALSPLPLLETIKRSHFLFNISSSSWLKHFLDIEMIHLIQKQYEIHAFIYFCTDDLLLLVYFDRLTKRVAKLALDSYGWEDNYIDQFIFQTDLKDDIREVTRDDHSEALFYAFNLKKVYVNPSFLGTSTESIEFMAQAIASYTLKTKLFRVVTPEELEKYILNSMQDTLDHNDYTYLFSVIIEGFWKIYERVFEILNQPKCLKALFNTEIEMVNLTFKNTPIHFEKDGVMDISNSNGLTICKRYLPIEIIMNIASYVHSSSEIIRLIRLDKSWYQTFANQNIWKYLYFSRYPTPSHYTEKSDYEAKNWKLNVLLRSKLPRIETLSSNAFKRLVDIFKSKFLGKPQVFKQFVTDFYMNTYILSKEETEDTSDESESLNAKLMIFWPRQAPLEFNVNIFIDNAMYRSGDSKGEGSRERVSVWYNGNNTSYRTHRPTNAGWMDEPHNFIGKHYLSELQSQQYTPLFSTLAILALGSKWTTKALGYSW